MNGDWDIPRPLDEPWEPPPALAGTAFAGRRVFFERNQKHRHRFFVCPACGYPTLHRRFSYESCSLCHWEDDGQDDPRADEPNGGPNDSSLTQARRNFNQTYSVWSWEEQGEFSQENWHRIFAPEAQERKAVLCRLYDRLMEVSEIDEIRHIWGEIRYRLRNRQ